MVSRMFAPVKSMTIRSMPRPEPAHRRCAVLEGPQEVLVQLHGLLVAAGREPGLGGEDLALDHRVDQLGEPGTALDPADDEVPRLDQPGGAAVRPGQRLRGIGTGTVILSSLQR